MSERICLVEECERPAAKRGYCQTHYQRYRRWGDPMGKNALRGEAVAWMRRHANHNGAGCLLWPFANARGRAYVYMNGRTRPAANLMCELAHGPPPFAKMHAAHSCRGAELGCVNPRHLSWKSVRDNSMDRWRDGTMRVGKQVSHAKLTADLVLTIYSSSAPAVELARQHNVLAGAIRDIRTGKRWAWLTGHKQRQ